MEDYKPLLDTSSIKFEDKELDVKINPFIASNNEPSLEDLCEALTPVLKNSELMLKELTKVYSISTEFPQMLKASKIEYKPTVTEAGSDEEAFNLKSPKQPLKVEYKPKTPESYLDRIWLAPDDVKFLLQNKKDIQNIFNRLVREMYLNLVKTKNLKTDKLYYGNVIATIEQPLSSFARNFRDDYIEIRMYSNATDLEGDVVDDVSGKNLETSETINQMAGSNK